MEIGVDCIEIARFEKLKDDPKFLSRIFTGREIDYCKSNKKSSQHFAARFAGKEAVIKALSGYGVKAELQQIEILNDDGGRPFVNLQVHKHEQYQVKISLSHADTIAMAFVIVERFSR